MKNLLVLITLVLITSDSIHCASQNPTGHRGAIKNSSKLRPDPPKGQSHYKAKCKDVYIGWRTCREVMTLLYPDGLYLFCEHYFRECCATCREPENPVAENNSRIRDNILKGFLNNINKRKN